MPEGAEAQPPALKAVVTIRSTDDLYADDIHYIFGALRPGDQRREDAGSLVFEIAPLDADLDIAGDASVTLAVEVNKPVAQISARLWMPHSPHGSIVPAFVGTQRKMSTLHAPRSDLMYRVENVTLSAHRQPGRPFVPVRLAYAA